MAVARSLARLPGLSGLRDRRRLVVLGLIAALLAVLTAMIVDGLPGRAGAAASSRAPELGTLGVPGWRTTGHLINAGGLRRGYLVARPLDPGPGPLPVIVLLHGRNMTPAGMARRSGLLETTRAIVVVPAGYGRSWNAGACCATARAAGVDDVAFLSRTVAQVLATQPAADPRAVYLVGYSNGGRMAYRMACQRPRLFAAVAAVEAVSVYPCRTVAAPVPLLTVASTGDPLLRITPAAAPRRIEGYQQPSLQDVVAVWRALDSCSSSITRRAAGRLTSYRWASCRGNSQVGLDLYCDGSHTWPPGSTVTPSALAQVSAFFDEVGARKAA
jgi:polyhydroxybutyrate depolymerase